MTITSEIGDGEYAGVLIRAGGSPIWRLIAPDNSTVSTYDYKPDLEVLKQDLIDGGYDVPADATIPFRDMTISDERLPGDITL
jgi:hypothetical protein